MELTSCVLPWSNVNHVAHTKSLQLARHVNNQFARCTEATSPPPQQRGGSSDLNLLAESNQRLLVLGEERGAPGRVFEQRTALAESSQDEVQ